MNSFNDFLDKTVDIELSGKKLITGILIDFGIDILVIYDGKKFLYIPFAHLQHIKHNKSNDSELQKPTETPITNNISYQKILNNANNSFLEIYVTGKHPIHGYLINILGDYLVFHSHIFKTMFISLHHIKWLIPYNCNIIPYSLDKKSLPAIPSNITLAKTFREQLQNHLGNIVIFDLGENLTKAGILQKVEDDVVELVMADGEKIFRNLKHLKTVHFP